MKIPESIIKKIETESKDLVYGKILCEMHIRNAKYIRFVISREQSIIATNMDAIEGK